MTEFQAQDPDFEARVRNSAARQQVLDSLGALLESVSPGRVVIGMPYSERFTQQNGYLHAGIVTTIMDSACGYAAFSLMPADAGVLSVEFKVNLLRPAAGDHFTAEGKVIKAGRTLTVCRGDCWGECDGSRRHIASITATMMTMHGRA